MVGDVLLAAAGLALLTVAADHLVLGASRLAAALRVSPVVVGVVVIGLGTSTPELLVSGVAAARGHGGIAVGNLVGSNILNVTLILGVAALIAPVAVRSSVVGREVPLTGAAVAVFALVGWIGLGWPAAVVLVAGLGAALVLLTRWGRVRAEPSLVAQVVEFTEPAVGTTGAVPRRSGWEAALRAVLGLAGVLVGAQLLVSSATAVAVRFGASQVVIGFTLVALGTSLPELVTTVQAQRRGESDLVVGNLFGSNLFNSLAGGAVVGLAGPARPPVRVTAALAVAMLLVTMLAWALVRRGLRLTRPEGGVLLLAYVLTWPLLTG